MATKKTPAKKAAPLAPKARPALNVPPPPRPRTALVRDPLAVGSGLHAHEPADEAEDAEMVMVVVPQGFKLTRDNYQIIDYPSGTYRMPASDARHWWSKNQGVEEVV